MDSLKLIPSVFFDFIARVIPGMTAILLYLYLSPMTLAEITADTLGKPFVESDSQFLTFLLFFIAAYICGQLIAPFAKIFQRIGELKWSKKLKKIEWLAPEPKSQKKAYDYLRMYYKDCGAQCAKIRAEFTMYNGLSVVFLASSIIYSWTQENFCIEFLAVFILLFIFTFIRGRTVRDTHHKTIKKFIKLTPFPEPPIQDNENVE